MTTVIRVGGALMQPPATDLGEQNRDASDLDCNGPRCAARRS